MYNFYDKVLHKLGKEKGEETVFINIGAMDGVTFDESSDYVTVYNYKSIYVEPVPEAFNKLTQNITDKRAILENSAISDYDGVIQMLMIDHTPIDKGEIHSCFYGMSAIYPPRNGLASDGDKETVQKYGKLIVVPCITLNTLFEKHDITHFDILSIDAEGHDWKILKQLDLTKYQPSVIRAEYINLTIDEQNELCAWFMKNQYIFEIEGQNIDAIPLELYQKLFNDNKSNAISKLITTPSTPNTEYNKNVTIVTGLWDMGRGEISSSFKRNYTEYLNRFKELLRCPNNMVIHVSEKDESFIWEHRKPENTVVKIVELSMFESWFEFFSQVQQIRRTPEWANQADWLPRSPQATLKYYNPVVMSKMFLLNDVSIINPFNTEYFYWIDAGITNTVHPGYFWHDKVFNNLPELSNHLGAFLFLSYPYEGGQEIHGFPRNKMAEYCNVDYVNYVCRGGFFGGKKDQVNAINGIYYHLLSDTLENNYMGTEESIFTIISHRYPDLVYNFSLEGNGLVWPFFEKLKDVKTIINTSGKPTINMNTVKNSLYILGFNSPEQFNSICTSIKKADSYLFLKSRKILINNSTDTSLFQKYDELCEIHNFEEIHRNNLGVCGGRQYVAEHFHDSDADFYMFFEDDMHLNNQEDMGSFCKNGFRKYVPDLYDTVVKIMLKEQFDFLKFSFSEFYGDNSTQWSWYNVPQAVRSDIWPDNDQLPKNGLGDNAPKTQFSTIAYMNNIPYITGEVYYSNWPQIVSRSGNYKMFIETKWEYPYEQTWMSYIFQKTRTKEITTGVLLASPVTHERFVHYDGSLRKES